jgi:hypothetical protein
MNTTNLLAIDGDALDVRSKDHGNVATSVTQRRTDHLGDDRADGLVLIGGQRLNHAARPGVRLDAARPTAIVEAHAEDRRNSDCPIARSRRRKWPLLRSCSTTSWRPNTAERRMRGRAWPTTRCAYGTAALAPSSNRRPLPKNRGGLTRRPAMRLPCARP